MFTSTSTIQLPIGLDWSGDLDSDANWMVKEKTNDVQMSRKGVKIYPNGNDNEQHGNKSSKVDLRKWLRMLYL